MPYMPQPAQFSSTSASPRSAGTAGAPNFELSAFGVVEGGEEDEVTKVASCCFPGEGPKIRDLLVITL